MLTSEGGSCSLWTGKDLDFMWMLRFCIILQSEFASFISIDLFPASVFFTSVPNSRDPWYFWSFLSRDIDAFSPSQVTCAVFNFAGELIWILKGSPMWTLSGTLISCGIFLPRVWVLAKIVVGLQNSTCKNHSVIIAPIFFFMGSIPCKIRHWNFHGSSSGAATTNQPGRKKNLLCFPTFFDRCLHLPVCQRSFRTMLLGCYNPLSVRLNYVYHSLDCK